MASPWDSKGVSRRRMLALSAAVPVGLAASAALPAGAADLTKIRIATVNSETSGAVTSCMKLAPALPNLVSVGQLVWNPR